MFVADWLHQPISCLWNFWNLISLFQFVLSLYPPSVWVGNAFADTTHTFSKNIVIFLCIPWESMPLHKRFLHNSFLGNSIPFPDFCWDDYVDALITCLVSSSEGFPGNPLSFSPEYAFPTFDFVILASFAIWIGQKPPKSPKSASTGFFLHNGFFFNVILSFYILL